MKNFFKSSYLAIILAFIYIPIVTMIIFSFNSGDTTASFLGFSTKWYESFFSNSPFIKSIITSLFVAMVSTVVSLIIGVLAVVGLWKHKPRTAKTWFNISNIPLINADVITAVGLMVVFVVAGLKFGIFTLIAAHISFCVPYVIITVMPFLKRIDKNIVDAAQDLGSTPTQTFFKVILPILRPSIITAGAICFAMSFDDFIISYFTGGDQTNVSTFIYTARKIQPYINAFGAFLVLTIFLIIIIWNIVRISKQKIETTYNQIRSGEYKQKEIGLLKSKLKEIETSIQTGIVIKKTKNIKLLIKYKMLKSKLKRLEKLNINRKISKLEWKKELLQNKIASDQKLAAKKASAENKITKLEAMLLKAKEGKKKSYQSAINKLEKKIYQFDKRIEIIKEQKEDDQLKIAALKQVLETKKHALQEHDSKEAQIQIKKIQIEINILIEGREKSQLRMTLEKLSHTKANIENKLRSTYEEITKLKPLIYKEVSLTENINNQINNLELNNNLSGSQINELENLKNTQKQHLEFKTNKLHVLATKVSDKLEEIKQLVINKQNKLFNTGNENPKPKTWIHRSWKNIALVGAIGFSFAGLTTAYVINNTYDLVVGNWGSYIDKALLNEFERENDVKINYQEFDSNESLYNKVRTFSYDIMVPSEYMIQRLGNEGHLQKLDLCKVNIDYSDFDTKSFKSCVGENQTDQQYHLNKYIFDTMAKSDFDSNGIASEDSTDIREYSVPYFWGSVIIFANTQKIEVVKWLEGKNVKIDPITGAMSNLDLDLLWQAQQEGKKVILNDDPKNLFSLGLSKLFGEVSPTVGTIGDLNETQQVMAAADEIKKLILPNNVGLYNDELTNKMATGDFDIGFGYNGDIVYGSQQWDANSANKLRDGTSIPFSWGVPQSNAKYKGYEEKVQSTNIWSDSMVLSRGARNTDLAYKFINFILKHAVEISDFVGRATGIQEGINGVVGGKDHNGNEVEGIESYTKYKNLFDAESHNWSWDGHTTPGSPYKLNPKIDDLMVNQLNTILAGKN